MRIVIFMERTLVLIKPDGVRRALIGRVIARFESAGLKVSGIKMVVPGRELVAKHYTDSEDWLRSVGAKAKKAYEAKGITPKESEVELGSKVRARLIDYLSSGPVVCMVIEGNESIFAVRKIVGSTEPRSADPSSIRGSLSTDSYALADSLDRPLKNIIHASEDKSSAESEISLWFEESELIKYKRADEDIIY